MGAIFSDLPEEVLSGSVEEKWTEKRSEGGGSEEWNGREEKQQPDVTVKEKMEKVKRKRTLGDGGKNMNDNEERRRSVENWRKGKVIEGGE